jgi:hypothetical protein
MARNLGWTSDDSSNSTQQFRSLERQFTVLAIAFDKFSSIFNNVVLPDERTLELPDRTVGHDSANLAYSPLFVLAWYIAMTLRGMS